MLAEKVMFLYKCSCLSTHICGRTHTHIFKAKMHKQKYTKLRKRFGDLALLAFCGLVLLRIIFGVFFEKKVMDDDC